MYVSGERLTLKELREKYRQLAHILNELDRQGEEICLIDDEHRVEIRGLSGHAFRLPNFKGTWRSD